MRIKDRILGNNPAKTNGKNSLGKGFSKEKEQSLQLEKSQLKFLTLTSSLEARFSMTFLGAPKI